MAAPGPSPALAAAMAHLQAGRLAQAEQALRRLLHRAPDPNAEMLLAKVLLDAGRPAEAAPLFERLVRLRPSDTALRLVLANTWIKAGDTDRALPILREAAALDSSAPVLEVVGHALTLAGRITEAEGFLRRAIALSPSENAVATLAQALAGQLRAPEAAAMLREDLRARPERPAVLQSLAFVLLYIDGVPPEELLRAHADAGRSIAATVAPAPVPTPSADPDRRLTVGWLSGDFRQHSCAFFMESLLAHRDRARFRAIAYSSSPPDERTPGFRALADEWRDVAPGPPEALAAQLARDGVDIAIDLAGYSGGRHLAALATRPVPIVATYLGYPSTTGIPAFDYRLVDSLTDPPGAEAWSTERLVRLDPCFLCYTPPERAPAPAPPPSAGTGFITFGSFNAPTKLSAATLDTWARLLHSIPGSRLLLKGRPFEDAGVRRRTHEEFSARDVAPDRIELLAWVADSRGHLAAYDRIDIALDPFPYNGTTTTCEALWMGVPVVTLAGRTHAGRVGVSLLSAVGVPDLIAPTPDAYIAAASNLARDPHRLATIRAGLREQVRASPLCDGPAHTRRFEAALRTAWRDWCRAARR